MGGSNLWSPVSTTYKKIIPKLKEKDSIDCCGLDFDADKGAFSDDEDFSVVTTQIDDANPVIVDLEGIKIGLTICYDIRFPEIYRAYRKANADILVNMAAWPLSRAIHWDSLTQARAVENQTYMVALTQT